MGPESTTIGVDERELDDAALEALAEAYATPPSPGLRERVVGGVVREAELSRARGRLRVQRLVGALAAVLVLALGGILTREMQRASGSRADLDAVRRQNAELAAQVEQQGIALATMRESLDAQAEVLRLVGGPRMLTASLAPQGGVAGAGRVLVDAATGEAAIVLSGLAPPPAGKAYELWAIRGKKPPEAAGMIAMSGERGTAARVPKVERPAEVTAFAVSIEPSGGSSSPTGPIVLVGPVAG